LLDLNPIKNIWSIVKGKLRKDHTITSLPKLERAIEMMRVKDLPLSLFKKVAHTMPATVG
jgi:hypothetical protein